MITFENSPVKIGDFNILAESASISLQTPMRGATRFGSPGYYSHVREGRAVGNVSVSYYMTSGDADVRNLFTGDGVQIFDISVGPYHCYSGVANSMSMNIEPYSAVSCTLDMSFYNGHDQGCTTGVQYAEGDWYDMSAYSFPLNAFFSIDGYVSIPCNPPTCWATGDAVTITWPVTEASPWSDGIDAEIYAFAVDETKCTIEYKIVDSDFYPSGAPGTDPFWPPEAAQITVSNDKGSTTGNIATPESLIHGGASEASTDLLWGTDLVSVNYSMAQSISPVYPFGELTPSGYTREGGTIEVDLQGTGWGHIVDTTTICEGYTTGNIRLESLCPCTSDLVYPDTDWDSLGIVGENERIFGTSNCPSCWEVGDTVTITSAEAGYPWNAGVPAEIYLMEECVDEGQEVYFEWEEGHEPPWGYEITVSNDSWSARHTIPFSGYVINPEITLDPNGELNGSLTVFGNLLEP